MPPNESQELDPEEIDTQKGLSHPNREKWRQGFEFMLRIAQTDPLQDPNCVNIVHLAQYNVGKAYFQGFGVEQSDELTEKWWLLAANDGLASGSLNAQTCLAFFYSRKLDPVFFDLKKAYYWHNEACGNGSLESQG